MEPAFLVEDLRVEFPTAEGAGTRALDGVTLAAAPGEFVSIVGPSGCGKSTLLLAVAGLIHPSAGRVEVAGAPLIGPHPTVSIVFQQDNLLEWRTILDNVVLPAEIRRLDRAAYRRRALDLLALVGLRGFEHRYPHQLSGGMRQRAALCRALMTDSRILLLDEPFGALDALTREEHQSLLQRLWLEGGTTMLLVTHDIREAVILSDRVAIMSPRPGVLREIVPIELPRPRPIELTETEAFNRYVGAIRRRLEHTTTPVVAGR